MAATADVPLRRPQQLVAVWLAALTWPADARWRACGPAAPSDAMFALLSSLSAHVTALRVAADPRAAGAHPLSDDAGFLLQLHVGPPLFPVQTRLIPVYLCAAKSMLSMAKLFPAGSSPTAFQAAGSKFKAMRASLSSRLAGSDRAAPGDGLAGMFVQSFALMLSATVFPFRASIYMRNVRMTRADVNLCKMA